MLATFVIGLREGLEAALIVGIIAAFLRKNGKSLTAMWAGVALALVLSIVVGVGLDLVEQALPQAAQEGMETIIGGIAIFFVTGMIAWMNKHARSMKRELEAQAAEALSQTSTFALAAMAFLAVLKEGFETAVFLLATFSAAQSAALAAAGAVLGILCAIVIGWGIYIGGVKINLSRFFRVTGAFLILVAAGLVITALRTAHEAGWLNAGQQATVHLAWLVAPGTVQSALITGVLGIPTDPRLVEVLGWCAYLIPVVAFVYWPEKHRPSARGILQLRLAIATGLCATAGILFVSYPAPRAALPAEAPLVSSADGAELGTARIADTGKALLLVVKGHESRIPLESSRAAGESRDGVAVRHWQFQWSRLPAHAPATLTLDQVFALNGGEAPIGLNFHLHPGPYTAQWLQTSRTEVSTAGRILLDAAQHTTTVLNIAGSGLFAPRTLILNENNTGNWQLSNEYGTAAAAALGTLAADQQERQFWALQLPLLLVLGALILAVTTALKGRAVARPTEDHSPHFPAQSSPEGRTHAAE